MLKFPQKFLWGAATSSYQVEGNNTNADWWDWEKRTGVQPSGNACRHYEFYDSDFGLAKLLNHNAHRLSIEWSRIEPRCGEFNETELKHYIDVITSLKKYGLEPVVTLHHFTNPLWFSRLNGWVNKDSVKHFLRYAEYVVSALVDTVNYWITINEPLIYVYQSYLMGWWPPQEKSPIKAKAVEDNFLSAHLACYKLIHQLYRNKNLPSPKISVAKNVRAFVPCGKSLKNKIAVSLRDKFFNFAFADKLIKHKSLDFIGLNYYTRDLVDVYGWGVGSLLSDICKNGHDARQKNSLGWDIYPEGLYDLLMKFNRYRLPIIITENGICTEDDSLRWKYIYEHLTSVYRAIQEGVDVRGYLYWSLIDNFEWDKGFAPRFGIIEVDYNTYQRRIRDSAYKFSNVCKTGNLE